MTRKSSLFAIAALSLLALSTGAQACGHHHDDLGYTHTRHCLGWGWLGM
jgi:hypothetical protein